jgi:hypothetical protein
MLLQEVNPLPEMAEQYITAMKRSGLHYKRFIRWTPAERLAH